MTLPPWLHADGEDVRVRIHAQPGAAKTQVVGTHGDAVKIRIQAPPVEGKANQALLRYLSRRLECRKNQLQLVSGEHSRKKVILVTGVEAGAVAHALATE